MIWFYVIPPPTSLRITVLSGPNLDIKPSFLGMGIPTLKIRRSRDHLIFDTGIPVLVRRHLYIETLSRTLESCSSLHHYLWISSLLYTEFRAAKLVHMSDTFLQMLPKFQYRIENLLSDEFVYLLCTEFTHMIIWCCDMMIRLIFVCHKTIKYHHNLKSQSLK